MTLVPCVGCRRHVALDASTCPFCGEALPTDRAAVQPRRAAGRLGRAAVFAGATLAGCYTSASSSQPPPPDDHHAHDVVVQPPPPAPIDAGSFAQPPPDASSATQQQVATGKVRGRITIAPGGHAFPGGAVKLFAQGQPTRRTRTDDYGEYVFEGLPAGTYTVVVEPPPPNHPRQNRGAPTTRQVHVVDGASARADVTVHMPPPVIDRGPCCKPYGAPPARRRIV